MSESFSAAVRFLQSEARLLEQRLFASLFLGEPPDGVVAALCGYQNDDGGFGHGLEPDKRCPASLPIDVEVALQAYASAGADDPDMLRRTCDFLARSSVGGAVALASDAIEAYPRAEHWSEWTYKPGLNPTAGLAGLLHRIGFAHPWRDEATRYCWRALESGALPDEVHALAEVLGFLEHAGEPDRAERHAKAVLERLTSSAMFHLDPEAEGYGLTPLTVAPAADSRWRSLFTEAQLDGHLDHLARAQEADGGWPISWEPPSAAARLEWRGIVTLGALRTLTSYGRLQPDP
jgi:hypothetical protein